MTRSNNSDGFRLASAGSTEPAATSRPDASRRGLPTWLAAVLVTAVVAAALLLQYSVEARNAAMLVGIEVEPGEEGLRVVAVSEGLPAAEAGIRPGATIVSVNDQPIRSVEDYDRALLPFEPGKTIDYVLERDGQDRALTVEPGGPFAWFRFLSTATPALAYLVLGLICLAQWRQDPRARLLAILVLAIALELSLPYAVLGQPLLHGAVIGLFFLLTAVQFAVELHLVSLIPGPAPWLRRWPGLPRIVYGLAALFGIGFALAAIVDGIQPGAAATSVVDAGYVAVEYLLPLWALSVGAILVHQMVHYSSPLGRQQAGLVLLGVVPWIAVTLVETGAVLLDRFLPVWWYSAGNWALFIFPITVFIAIFRYHLFDLEMVVRRSLVFGSITALVVGALYALLATGWPVAAQWMGESGAAWLVTALALGLGIFAHRVRGSVEHAIEQRIFPERHALRRHLIRLAASLPVRGKLPLMGAHLADEVCLAFRASNSAVIMIDPRSQLPYSLAAARIPNERAEALAALFRTEPRLESIVSEQRRPIPFERLYRRAPDLAERVNSTGFRVLVPLHSHDRFIGVLCLGPKQSGDAYPGEELELLNLLSHHVTTAFENARLTEHATYDGLTGIYRREVILEVLERECGRAIQCNEPIAVAMVDIDRFKAFNDDHGHLAGDFILQRVARTLQGELRSTDLVGRYGGEEFMAVLPSTDLEGARTATEHLRTGIEMMRIPLESGVTVNVNVSVGLAAVKKASGNAAELARRMLESADQYLYEAKQAGRNRVVGGDHAAA